MACPDPSGTGIFTYLPNARLAFPRSYIQAISVAAPTTDVDWTGETLLMWLDRSISYGSALKFFVPALAWSSNRYTLDHIVCDAWWFAFGDGIHHPDAATIDCTTSPTTGAPVILVTPSTTGTHKFVVSTGEAPPTYWLPPYPT